MASELRLHELVALSTCFVSPLIGAWLLHTIRSQLSRPSEGLVSNYNLTIFLLAAELRPLAHLTKLVQARTLYLQRSLSPSPSTEAINPDLQTIQDLSARLDDLEAHIATFVPPPTKTSTPTTSPTPAHITTEVRKSLQPDLDALNRAVRRYEKRATLLSMQTESRLQDLESRMADAITLAAAAERSITQKPKYASALTLLDWICAAVLLPLQTIQVCINLPGKIARSALATVKGYFFTISRRKPAKPTTVRVVGRGSGAESGNASSERRSGVVKLRGTKKLY